MSGRSPQVLTIRMRSGRSDQVLTVCMSSSRSLQVLTVCMSSGRSPSGTTSGTSSAVYTSGVNRGGKMFCSRREICSVVNLLSNPSNTRYRNEYDYKRNITKVSIHHSSERSPHFYGQKKSCKHRSLKRQTACNIFLSAPNLFCFHLLIS